VVCHPVLNRLRIGQRLCGRVVWYVWAWHCSYRAIVVERQIHVLLAPHYGRVVRVWLAVGPLLGLGSSVWVWEEGDAVCQLSMVLRYPVAVVRAEAAGVAYRCIVWRVRSVCGWQPHA